MGVGDPGLVPALPSCLNRMLPLLWTFFSPLYNRSPGLHACRGSGQLCG